MAEPRVPPPSVPTERIDPPGQDEETMDASSPDLLPPPQPMTPPAINLAGLDTQPQTPPGPTTPAGRPSVPGYEVMEKLGEGGMGFVYKARQVGLDRLVALKMVHANRADTVYRARFRREAQAIARLKHPNIVAVYDFGEHEGQPYLVLEYVPGGTLAGRLDGKPWPARKAAELVATLAGALDHAHRQGVLHRDLKPANILLDTEGKPQISDFGLARALRREGELTVPGLVLGTPNYMPPEQANARNDQIGPATDIFGLGAILYELLTGRPPYVGPDAHTTLEQAASGDIVPVRHINPKVPRALARVCERALSADPARRQGSGAELERDLRRFLTRPRRLALGALAIAALLLAVAGGVAGALGLFSRPEKTTTPLSGDLHVKIWSKDGKNLWPVDSVTQPVLPVKNGELMRIQVSLTRPAHMYLFWIRPSGEVEALHPWPAGAEGVPMPPPLQDVSNKVTSPPLDMAPQKVGGWEMNGRSGLETVLLLARDAPISETLRLEAILRSLGPAPLHERWEVIVRGQDGDHDVEPLALFRRRKVQVKEIDDPLLRLMERLRPHVDMVRAVRFAHEGD
jgi:serine/threonine-protein kinase